MWNFADSSVKRKDDKVPSRQILPDLLADVEKGLSGLRVRLSSSSDEWEPTKKGSLWPLTLHWKG